MEIAGQDSMEINKMTLDWVNGVYSPALRTRLIDRAQQLATPDCDPLRDWECPLCSS
jgi:hypothetical protein